MAEQINGKLSTGQSLSASLSGASSFSGTFASASNYNSLTGKPVLNGATLAGNKVSGDYYLATVLFDTTANWSALTDTVSVKDTVYVYTDYKQTERGTIAGVKVGDGTTYIVDLPFIDELFQEHAADTDIHVTTEEKAFWNAKNRAIAYGETLVLTDL